MSNSQPPPKPGGYPQLCEFINSSPSHTFQIFRRFGALNTRCLLYMQDEICQLEGKLADIDALPEYMNDTRRFDTHPERPELVRQITGKLVKYNELLNSTIEKLAQQPANSNQYNNFRYWFDHKNPIVTEEYDFLRFPYDMVGLGPQDDWFSERIKRLDLPFIRDKKAHTSEEYAQEALYYTVNSRKRLMRFVRGIVILAGLMGLLAPILGVFFCKSKGGRLAVVCSAVAIFTLIVASVTSAKNVEVLAAMAAYSAVMVVFLGAV